MQHNDSLRFEDRAAFIEYMNEDQPIRPANILNIVAINQGRHPYSWDEPQAPALEVAEFADLMKDGHLVVDTRPSAAYGEGHVPGAYNLQLMSPEFEQRVGWVTPADEPLLLVLDEGEDAARALRRLAFLGLDQRVEGYLAGGMAAWADAGRAHTTVRQVSVDELNAQLDDGVAVLDVRSDAEWAAGHIASAQHIDFRLLRQRVGEVRFGREEPLAVICAAGVRSSTACSVLLQSGFSQLHNVTGGMGAWFAAGFDTVS